MIAVYAMGDGLGHLTRVAAALHTLGVDPTDAVLLTASGHAHDRRVTGAARVLRIEPADVTGTLVDLQPRELWVDAFPAGWRGELGSAALPPSVVTTRYFARRLRWAVYEPLVGADPIAFDHVHRLEPLELGHVAFVDRVARHADGLALVDPPSRPSPDDLRWFERVPPPRWLVAHAGPASETAELVAYARDMACAEGLEPSIVAATPNELDAAPRRDCYPVWPLFSQADRVVTAAGFNAMRQGQALAGAERHRFVPFARRLDDQFARARRARSCTSPA
jgi:hypothetical protein